MAKTIIVGGYGPGISNAVAEKFGAEGFSVALVARNADKLNAGVKSLAEKGVEAAAFKGDLAHATEVREIVRNVRASLGNITAILWNAYGGTAGDLLTADTVALHSVFDVAVTGMLAAIQEALPDLKKADKPAILITNGGLGFFDPQVDAMAVQWNSMGLAVANSAKHKVVGLLSHKLKDDGVYVGEVVVLGTVKGTAWDQGDAKLDPADIGQKFWDLYRSRNETSVTFGG